MDRPSYHNIGDHTEAVQVDFDPRRISYADLLAIFWDSHRPASQSTRRQYWHAVFYHDARQQQMALESRNRVANRLGRPVRTEVLPLQSFTRAEDYHQKYILKRERALMRELSQMFPDHRDLVDSTAAARLNAYVGGYGSPAQFERESEALGLSPISRDKVARLVRRKMRHN
jgi:hypothetical protein